jgi:hypothetical protein
MNTASYYERLRDMYPHNFVGDNLDAYELRGYAVALSLRQRGYASIVFEPHNATRYDLTFARRDRDGHVVVALTNFNSSCDFSSLEALHPLYLTEKLGVNEADAAVLSVLFHAVHNEMVEVEA